MKLFVSSDYLILDKSVNLYIHGQRAECQGTSLIQYKNSRQLFCRSMENNQTGVYSGNVTRQSPSAQACATTYTRCYAFDSVFSKHNSGNFINIFFRSL